MGYAEIIWLYEDGIRSAKYSQKERERLKPEVGDAVLEVCSAWKDGVTYGRVGNHANCVMFCAEVHSEWTELFLWHGNCLRPLRKLDDDDLEVAERLLAEARANRSTTP